MPGTLLWDRWHRGMQRMKLFFADSISIPHGVLDFLGTCALTVGAATWAHHRKWREKMERNSRACVLGINYLLSRDAEVPDFIKNTLEAAAEEK